jgi:hypothetical protein
MKMNTQQQETYKRHYRYQHLKTGHVGENFGVQ